MEEVLESGGKAEGTDGFVGVLKRAGEKEVGAWEWDVGRWEIRG